MPSCLKFCFFYRDGAYSKLGPGLENIQNVLYSLIEFSVAQICQKGPLSYQYTLLVQL